MSEILIATDEILVALSNSPRGRLDTTTRTKISFVAQNGPESPDAEDPGVREVITVATALQRDAKPLPLRKLA